MSLFSPLLDNDSRSECHKFTSMDQLPIVAPTKIIGQKTSPEVSEIMSHLYQGLDPKEQIYQLFLKWFEMSEIKDCTYDTLMKAAGDIKARLLADYFKEKARVEENKTFDLSPSPLESLHTIEKRKLHSIAINAPMINPDIPSVLRFRKKAGNFREHLEGDQMFFDPVQDFGYSERLVASVTEIADLPPVPSLEPTPQPPTPTPDPHPPVPPEPAILSLTRFLEYRLLGYISKHPRATKLGRNIVLMMIYAFFIIQLVETALVSRLLENKVSFPSKCYHSGLAFVLTVTLRSLTRCLFPLVLSMNFHHVISKRFMKGQFFDDQSHKTFIWEIEQEENFDVVRKVIYLFGDELLAMAVKSKKDIKVLLTHLRKEFEADMHMMCITSILEGVILTLGIMSLGALEYSVADIPNKMTMNGTNILKLFDVASCLFLNIFGGLMLSIFFFEFKIKFLISSIINAESLSCKHKEIDTKAKLNDDLKKKSIFMVDAISSNWCFVEILLYLGCAFYSVLLVIASASGLPLSCGIVMEKADFYEELQVHWLWTVILITFFHLLATSIFAIPLVRPVGIILEVAGILFLYVTFEGSATSFTRYMQILYAIFPLCYIFWYQVVTIVHEFAFAYCAKGFIYAHVRRLAFCITLLMAMIVAVGFSIYNEYLLLGMQGSDSFDRNTPQKTFNRICDTGAGIFSEYCVCNSDRDPFCSCLSKQI